MDIVLNHGEIVCIGGDARNLSVSCRTGCLWVTQPGDPDDHMLMPGQTFIINRKGKIAITALYAASVHFTTPVELKQPCRPWQVQPA